MSTRCFAPLLGKRIRVTTVDSCGALPATATPNVVLATDGFISVSLSAETEDGVEILTKKADGSLCVNEKFADSFKRFTVEATFCGVNPSLLSMISNVETYLNYAGNIGGFTIAEGRLNTYFALELWTGLAGGACSPTLAEAGGYMLLPFLAGGVLGDLEVNGEDAVNFSVTGMYTKGGNQWGVGPFSVMNGIGTSEKQQVAITGVPTGGTFTLSFKGQTTAPIQYNATSANVVSALEALSCIGTGGVTATGGPLPATPVVVTFASALASQNVPQMTANSAALTGGTSPTVAVTTTVPGVQGAASALPVALDPFDHLLLVETGIAPPPSACNPSAMP